MTLTLVGRSSSHFTRVTRIFAHELGLPHQFRPVFDLTSLDPAVYGDNPALKVPVLLDEQGPLFGAENICRELVRRAGPRGARVVLRGETTNRAVVNAEELTLHAMSTGVVLIMANLAGAEREAPPKVMASLQNSLTYLERRLHDALGELPPERATSFLEISLFCVVRHLEFRGLLDTLPWPRLRAFAAGFDQRASALATVYQFDVPG